MSKRLLLLATLFLIMGLFGGTQAAFAGARLYFEPASGSYENGSEFTVTVKIDTGGEEAMTTDVAINFDSSRLTVSQVANGGFFTGFDYILEADSGRLMIYSFSQQPLQTKSGTGDIAIITFKATGEGEAPVSLFCQAGGDTDSNIWDVQGNDLIDCSANGSGSYTIGGTGSNDASSGDESSSSSDSSSSSSSIETAPEAPTPTPSQLPETGVETPLLILGISGGIMLLLSLSITL